MNTTNYANEIVSNLEKKGMSKDYIIGFLTATIEGLKHLTESEAITKYLQQTVNQAKRA